QHDAMTGMAVADRRIDQQKTPMRRAERDRGLSKKRCVAAEDRSRERPTTPLRQRKCILLLAILDDGCHRSEHFQLVYGLRVLAIAQLEEYRRHKCSLLRAAIDRSKILGAVGHLGRLPQTIDTFFDR